MNLVHLENDEALPGVASENPSKQLVRTQNNGFWNGLQERNISVQILAVVFHDIFKKFANQCDNGFWNRTAYNSSVQILIIVLHDIFKIFANDCDNGFWN